MLNKQPTIHKYFTVAFTLIFQFNINEPAKVLSTYFLLLYKLFCLLSDNLRKNFVFVRFSIIYSETYIARKMLFQI